MKQDKETDPMEYLLSYWNALIILSIAYKVLFRVLCEKLKPLVYKLIGPLSISEFDTIGDIKGAHSFI